MQKAEAYPSLKLLRHNKPIQYLTPSSGTPSSDEINANISAFLDPKAPPKIKLQVVVTDGVALEELARFNAKENTIIGLCREHLLVKMVKMVHEDKVVHYGKDGTSGKWISP